MCLRDEHWHSDELTMDHGEHQQLSRAKVVPDQRHCLIRRLTKQQNYLSAKRRLRSAWIRPVRSQSSLCAQWVAKDQIFLRADSKDSDQTGGCAQVILLVLSCGGPFISYQHSIWAATWQNQQSDCAPSEDSDQSGHPPSLIRVFALRSVGS